MRSLAVWIKLGRTNSFNFSWKFSRAKRFPTFFLQARLIQILISHHISKLFFGNVWIFQGSGHTKKHTIHENFNSASRTPVSFTDPWMEPKNVGFLHVTFSLVPSKGYISPFFVENCHEMWPFQQESLFSHEQFEKFARNWSYSKDAKCPTLVWFLSF